MDRPRRLIPVALALAVLSFPGRWTSTDRGDGWSPEYRESLRRTAELRRQRRRDGGGGQVGVGTIQTYPMPPALIIRQTPENHDEIRDLLRLLRGT